MKKLIAPLSCAIILVPLIAGLSPRPATAIPITFTVSSTATDDGKPQQASATFDLSGTMLSLTLANTGGPGEIAAITSVLDGLAFNSGGSLTSISFTGATAANGTVLCTSTSCTFTPGVVSDDTSFFGWKIQSGTPGSEVVIGPQGWKPKGIVNDNVTNLDGIKNPQHNPYLNGPVTFTFDVAYTATPSFSDVRFYFGTEPDVKTGTGTVPSLAPVPEPSTLLLIGTGLIGMGRSLRKRRSQSVEGC